MAHDPEVSHSQAVRGVCAERLASWAYARRVVVESDDGDTTICIHLTVALAQEHIRNVQASIAAAVMLGG